jgi:hypothetical protein
MKTANIMTSTLRTMLSEAAQAYQNFVYGGMQTARKKPLEACALIASLGCTIYLSAKREVDELHREVPAVRTIDSLVAAQTTTCMQAYEARNFPRCSQALEETAVLLGTPELRAVQSELLAANTSLEGGKGLLILGLAGMASVGAYKTVKYVTKKKEQQ